MKKQASRFVVLFGCFIALFLLPGCDQSQESKDRQIVDKQQAHYAKTQPIPFYDYSIPRDILIQIYNVITQESRNTYTVIETVMGQTKFHGPSLGYGIPADVSVTNPLQPAFPRRLSNGEVIEQAEPNGVFSSKNTDGTWVLFIDDNGDITPVYTEHKVTTFPFAVKKDETGGWIRADKKKSSLTIKIKSNKGN
ncbi:MAG: hypothetical protein US74_C0010G0003 [Parcubacteria group bacterium GW2011_GWA2_38_13]|nr:MAG: hypothetical protein US74_C0010G0003 [Parcubacteria group bacterium GW2011_GWA2_38_13]